MFDVGASEFLLIVIVAIVVIGPKDMPLALRSAGRWIGKVRRVSGHFRSGIETMIREAELEEMEAKWREKNAAVMAEYPDTMSESLVATPPEASAEAGVGELAAPTEPAPSSGTASPQLPLSPP